MLFASMGFVAAAQTTIEPEYAKRAIAECQRLHSNGEYATALTLIEKIDARELDERTRQEFDLLKALTTFKNDHHKGKALMMQYLNDYPNSSQRELLDCHIAQALYFEGDFDGACTLFAQSDMSRLAKAEREEATLHYALSLLENGQES